MDNNQFLKRLYELIEEGIALTNLSVRVKYYNPMRYDISHYTKCHYWWLSCSNLLRSFFGENHTFFNSFKHSSSNWQRVISPEVKQPIAYPQEDMASAYAVLIYIKK